MTEGICEICNNKRVFSDPLYPICYSCDDGLYRADQPNYIDSHCVDCDIRLTVGRKHRCETCNSHYEEDPDDLYF